jgi:hypothetical protein
MEFEMNLEQTLNEITGKLYGKNIGACTDAQLYTGVLQLTKDSRHYRRQEGILYFHGVPDR